MKNNQQKTFSQQELLEAYPNQFDLTRSAINLAYGYMNNEKKFSIDSLLRDLKNDINASDET